MRQQTKVHTPVQRNVCQDGLARQVGIGVPAQVPGGQRDGGRVLARLIQKSIFEATGLTCSVGVAPNKLLAKMASEFNKPNSISIVYYAAWDRDDRPVETESEPVSMSRETTFDRDLHAVRDRAELGTIFTDLCERVAADLQRKGYVGKTIGVKLRYGDFKIVTRDQTLAEFTADAKTIRHTAGLCLKRIDLTRRFRLLGVRVGTLAKAPGPGEVPVVPATPAAQPPGPATMDQLF